MTASIDIVVAQLFLAIIAFNIPSYNIERWHTFLSYQALNLITVAYNLFALKGAPWTHNIGCKSSPSPLHLDCEMLTSELSVIVSLASFFVISITCLAITQPKQSSYHVWHDFINNTGWDSDALVFLLGLINPTYGFGGLDGAVHLAEDCFEPARTVPRALCSSLVVGFTTAFFLVVSMLYCVKDTQGAIDSRTGLVLPSSNNLNSIVIYAIAYRYTRYGSKPPDLEQRLQLSWPR